MFFEMQGILKEYRNKPCLWGLKPNKYVIEIPKLLKNGKILDLGVGEGKNSLFLAKKGFNVIGVDILELAIKKFLKLAKERKVKVKGIVEDILNYASKEKYDAVICTVTLHFIPKNKMGAVIENMKKMTKKGGLNLITAFTEKDPAYHKNSRLNFIKENYLQGMYKDWEILKNTCYIKKDMHGKPHKHHICALLARKPSY